jgi:hypothetical protein
LEAVATQATVAESSGLTRLTDTMRGGAFVDDAAEAEEAEAEDDGLLPPPTECRRGQTVAASRSGRATVATWAKEVPAAPKSYRDRAPLFDRAYRTAR